MTTPGISDLSPRRCPRLGDAGRVQRVTPKRAAPARTGWRCPPPRRGRGSPRRVEVVVEALAHRADGDVGVAGSRRRVPPALEARLRIHDVGAVPLPVAAVVVDEHGEADGVGVPVLQQVADEDQVPERLRHLLAAEADQSDVEPVPDEGLARHRLGLGGLALVVGEHEVPAAAVDVEGDPSSRSASAEHSMCHPGGPGPSATPRPARREARAARARSRAGRACSGRRIAAVDRSELEHLGAVEVADLPELGKVATSKYTAPRPGRRGRLRGTSRRGRGSRRWPTSPGARSRRVTGERADVGVEAGHLFGGEVE